MRLIDLSHTIENGQPGFPGDPAAELSLWATVDQQGYHISRLCLSTHHGTHVDLPYHVVPGGITAATAPVQWFCGPARLVDLAPSSALPAGTAISVAMLEVHERGFEPGGRVLVRTGWDRRFGSPEYYRDYPRFTEEAAQWLVSRRIRLLGMDTPSPEADTNRIHRLLLESDVVLIENLCRLEELPEEFILCALPLKLSGGDGSPVRAVALVPA